MARSGGAKESGKLPSGYISVEASNKGLGQPRCAAEYGIEPLHGTAPGGATRLIAAVFTAACASATDAAVSFDPPSPFY